MGVARNFVVRGILASRAAGTATVGIVGVEPGIGTGGVGSDIAGNLPLGVENRRSVAAVVGTVVVLAMALELKKGPVVEIVVEVAPELGAELVVPEVELQVVWMEVVLELLVVVKVDLVDLVC